MVHTGGVEFEGRKRRSVDLISFDTTIQIKVFKCVCNKVQRELLSYLNLFHTSQFGLEMHEHFNNILKLNMSRLILYYFK